MTPISRLNLLALGLVALSAVLAFAFGPSLPDPVPTHWNAAGEVDGWTAKPLGVWLFPLVAGSLWLLFLFLPVISPRGFRLDTARRTYDIVRVAMMGFLLAVQGITYAAALDIGPGVNLSVPLLVGLLFVVLGNYLGKFPKNFFVGVRTPWTLASDEVWNRTHRLAGWTFTAAGFAMVGIALLAPRAIEWFIGVVVVAAVVPIAYSFLLYRRLHGFGADDVD